jgi:uncharacterized protein
MPIDSSMQFILDCSGENDNWNIQEIELKEEDIDTVSLVEPVVDILDILRQQLYLSLPVRNICADGCQGLCPVCGINLNQECCTCSETRRQSPFAVLEKLKKQ